MKKLVILMFGIVFLLVGCAQANETPPTQMPTEMPADTKVPPTDTPEPTATEIPPTNTPEPTSTPEPPTLTPLPDGTMFRDDFEGNLQPGWTWINEDTNRWSFVEGGWLEIVGDDPGLYGASDFALINFLTRDVPEGEYVISTHVPSNPTEN